MSLRTLFGCFSLLASFHLAQAASGADIEVSVIGRFVDGDQEILALRPKSLPAGIGPSTRITLDQPAGRPAPWSGFSSSDAQDNLLLVRRQLPPPGERQSGVMVPRMRSKRDKLPAPVRFDIPDAAKAPQDPSLKSRWLRSLRDGLGAMQGPWDDFARVRVDELTRAIEAKDGIGKRGGAATRAGVTANRRRADPMSLRKLMDTTTGLQSLQEALQTDRELRTQFASESATVPLAQVAGPALQQHPWPEMLAALGRAAPDEPLAHATPARFYYLRFASLSHLFRVLDEADAWITPMAAMSSSSSQNQDLGKRYEAQLGLQRSLTSRLLGPQVVAELALVGSDPYLREGTDLTFIFRVKSAAAFAAGLASSLGGHLAEHGKQTVETFTHAGETIVVARSVDGVVRQHRAQVGDLALVSNSPGAIKAVIDTLKRKSPALADAPDFRYMMARDAAVPADVLGFMSDAFVAEVIGPRQKILESRRLLALSDLMVPGYASLLYGWMYGRAPRSVDELKAAGLLASEELKHVSGGAIAFSPGSPAQSSWGSLGALTPLIDLPTPAKVTASERDAYRMFADSYQRNWSQYMDPACLRAKVDPSPGKPMRVDLRVLPIIDASEYREMQRTVGDARIEVSALGNGAMASLGVGPRASLRKMVREMAHGLPVGLGAQLDWLGDLAFLGLEDRFDAKGVLELYNREGRTREEDVTRLLVEAPLFAGVGVRNSLTAGLALGLLRKLATDAAPGAVDWRERGKERGIPYVGVSAVRGGEAHRFAGDINLYYAFCKDYLLLSLSEATLKARIGNCMDGRLPKTAKPGTPAGAQPAQLVFALSMKKGGALWTLAGAGIAVAMEEAQEGANHAALALLHGAPGLDRAVLRRLALAYFGSVPVDSSGADLLANAQLLSADRPRSRGHQGKLVPAADNSPAMQLVAAFANARSELAFDQEVTIAGEQEPIQSLHVVFSVGGDK